jgi:hypothetical protein
MKEALSLNPISGIAAIIAQLQQSAMRDEAAQ